MFVQNESPFGDATSMQDHPAAGRAYVSFRADYQG